MGGLLVALTASLAYGSPQDGPWTARFDAAVAAGEVRGVAALLDELERADPSAFAALRAGSRGRLDDSAFAILGGKSSTGLRARAELARELARRLGVAEDALRVETELAKGLIDAGSPEEARSTLEVALREHAAAHVTRPEALLWMGNAERALALWDAAFARYSESLASSTAEAEAARRRGPAAASVLAYELALGIEVHLELVSERLDLGLPDLAYAALREAKERLAGMPPGESADHERVQITLVEARLLDATGRSADGEALLQDLLGPVPDAPSPEELAILVRIGDYRAHALLLGQAPADRAEEARRMLELGLGSPALSEADHARAELTLAELELFQGHFATAREHVAAVRRTLGEDTRGGADPILSRARMAWIDAEIALGERADEQILGPRRDELRRALDAMLAMWRRRGLRDGGVGFLYWASYRQPVATLMRLERALAPGSSGDERASDVLFAAQAVGTLASKLGAASTDIAEVRAQLLDDSSGILAYLPGPRSTIVVAVSRANARVFELAPQKVIETRVDDVRRALTPPDPSADAAARRSRRETLDASLRALGNELLPPEVLDAMAGWRGVYVSGAELLQNAVFELLPFRRTDLGRELAVAGLPSVPVAVQLARSAARPGARRVLARPDFALIAAPEPSRSAIARHGRLTQAIPFDEKTEHAMLAMRHGRGIAIRTRRGATLRALEDPDVAGARVLAILAHGVQDFARELPAGLALAAGDDTDGSASDGIAWFAELARGVPCAPVVLLGACGSAYGPSRLGDDTGAHLGTAFLLRGARTVVLSRHDVAYPAMVELVRIAVPAILDEDLSTAEALRLTRVRLAEDPATNDPYLYGLVSAYGLGLEALGASAADGGPVEPTQTAGSVGANPASRSVFSMPWAAIVAGLFAVIAVLAAAISAWRRARASRSV